MHHPEETPEFPLKIIVPLAAGLISPSPAFGQSRKTRGRPGSGPPVLVVEVAADLVIKADEFMSGVVDCG